MNNNGLIKHKQFLHILKNRNTLVYILIPSDPPIFIKLYWYKTTRTPGYTTRIEKEQKNVHLSKGNKRCETPNR
jgi:hypothetical protein